MGVCSICIDLSWEVRNRSPWDTPGTAAQLAAQPAGLLGHVRTALAGHLPEPGGPAKGPALRLTRNRSCRGEMMRFALILPNLERALRPRR